MKKFLKDIGTQNFYYLYLLGILKEYLISYFGGGLSRLVVEKI
jgi:hypothetical protein